MTETMTEHGLTRERILDAAERLFSEKGFDATSIRDITTDAECNLAAVNYHFGGKDKLYLETFRRLLVNLRDRRISLMREDMERNLDPTLESFLASFSRGFIEPFVDGGRGRFMMMLISREMVDSRLPKEVFLTEFIQPMLAVTVDGLKRHEPKLDSMTARRCVMSLVGQLLHTVGGRHHFMPQDHEGILPSDLQGHLDHIVRFSAAGIRACVAPVEAAK